MSSKNKYIVCIVETRTLDVQHLEYNTKRIYIGWMCSNIPMQKSKYVPKDYTQLLLDDKNSAKETVALYRRCHPLSPEMKRTIEIVKVKPTNAGEFELVLPDIFEEFAKNDKKFSSTQKTVQWFTDVYNMTVDEVLQKYGEYLKSDKYASWKDRNMPANETT